MSDQDYVNMLRALYARASLGIKLGLQTMQALLDALGRPDARMRHIIVAGTNGKGSTSKIIASALGISGHRTGHYSSPHLLRFTERICCGDREIDAATAVRLYERVVSAASACPQAPTFFEIVTAMALLAFAEANVDIAVLEVGLGGRLDATNAVNKLLAVITPVDLDHMHLLGDTIDKIAYEKAGVIPPGGCVVVAAQAKTALMVIDEVARERGARVVHARDFVTTATAAELSYERGVLSFATLPPGAYQRTNLATAATALMELDRLGIACPAHAVIRAAAELSWPGRYQWIGDTPPFLVDGAHNPAAIRALLAALNEDPRVANRPVHFVSTVLNDRPAAEMLQPLQDRASSLQLTPVSSARSRQPQELARLAPAATVHDCPRSAVAAAIHLAVVDGGCVVVCGSLYLAGEVLALASGEPRDPSIDA